MSYVMSAELAVYELLAQEIYRRIYAGTDPRELNQWLYVQLGKLGQPVSEQNLLEWRRSFEFYEEVIATARQRAALPESEQYRIDFPWGSWNRLIGELEPGMLMSLAGASGAGKTIYAEGLADHWAKSGLSVVFVHLELNQRLMMHRRASRHTNLDYRTLRQGAVGEDNKLLLMRQQLEGWRGSINYLHAPGWTMERILQALDHLRGKDACDVVIVDYLEKIALPKNARDQWQAEADMVEEAKNYGEAVGIPFVLLSQIGKGKQGNLLPTDRLTPADIKGAAAKYERGNVIVLFHRNIDKDGQREPKVRVFVPKNTVGPTGEFFQFMDSEHFRVGDIIESSPLQQGTLK